MQSVPLAIVAALDDEVRIVRSRMSIDERLHLRPALLIRGTYEGMPLVLLRSGMGRKAMEQAAAYLLERYAPDLILHVGYCGAAIPALTAGDLVIASEVVDARNGERLSVSEALVHRAEHVCHELELRANAAPIVTVEAVATTPHEKGALGAAHGAAGIDMESVAVARAASERGVPYLVVRAVLDPLDCAVPDFADALDDEGEASGPKFAEHLLHAPRDLLALPKLGYFAAQARTAIAAFVDAWRKERL
jgi:adenosylhomocysteine nucleosidase